MLLGKKHRRQEKLHTQEKFAIKKNSAKPFHQHNL